MYYEGPAEGFAEKVRRQEARDEELVHFNQEVADLEAELAEGEDPAPVYLEQQYRCRVIDVDRSTFRCTVDAQTPEGLIRGVRYGRSHPKEDEEYPLFIPTDGTEPWIEVPEAIEGNWLYWMTSFLPEDSWCVVRSPWPPVDEDPVIQVVIRDVPFLRRLEGVDGDGGVWLVERERESYQTDIPRQMFRYKNYGFDDAPDVYTIGGKWHICRVDNSPRSHANETDGSSSIIARQTVLGHEPNAYFDMYRDTTPPNPPGVGPGPGQNPFFWEGAIVLPGGPLGGFGGFLVIRGHGFTWPPSHPEVPFYPPHQHGGFVDMPFYGLKAGIPGAHPPDLTCCQQQLSRGGINPLYWMPDHAHGPAADWPWQSDNAPNANAYYVTGDPLWRQWVEVEDHLHWEVFGADGRMVPHDAPGGGIIGPDAPPDDPASYGGLDPNAGKTYYDLDWNEYHYHTRDKDQGWEEVYVVNTREILMPRETNEVHVENGSPATLPEGAGFIPPGGFGYYPGPPPPPPSMDPETLARLYRCGGSCASASGGGVGNDGPAPADLPPGDPNYDPNNHIPPIIRTYRYRMQHFRGREYDLLERTRMWTDGDGERHYAIVEQHYATPEDAYGHLVFDLNNGGWHIQYAVNAEGWYIPVGESAIYLDFPKMRIRAADNGVPFVVYATGPDEDDKVSCIAKYATSRNNGTVGVWIADDVTASWQPFDVFPFLEFIDQTWNMEHMLATDSEGSFWDGGFKYHYTTNRGDDWHVVGWRDPSFLPYNQDFQQLFSSDPRFNPAYIVIMR